MGGVAGGPARAILLVLSCPPVAPKVKSATFTTLHFALAYYRFKDAGFEPVVATPAGGRPPVAAAPVSARSDQLLERYRRDAAARDDLADCLRLEQVDPEDFRSAFVVASHGSLQELEADGRSAEITRALARPDCALALVGAAPALLCHVLDCANRSFIAGRRVTGASRREEEEVWGADGPGGLPVEERLRGAGFLYSAAPPWHAHMVQDESLITAQNLQSVGLAADALVRLIA